MRGRKTKKWAGIMAGVLLLSAVLLGGNIRFTTSRWNVPSEPVRSLIGDYGFETITGNFFWEQLEPKAGDVNFSSLYEFIDRAAAADIDHFVLCVTGTPLWNSTVPVKWEDICPDGLPTRWDTVTYELLVQKLEYSAWTLRDVAAWKDFIYSFVEAAVEYIQSHYPWCSVDAVQLWDEVDRLRLKAVWNFYDLFVDGNGGLYADTVLGDTVLEIFKLEDRADETTAPLNIKVWVDDQLIWDKDITLSVSDIFVDSLKRDFWVPSYYCENIVAAACETLSVYPGAADIKIIPAALRYSKFESYEDAIPVYNWLSEYLPPHHTYFRYDFSSLELLDEWIIGLWIWHGSHGQPFSYYVDYINHKFFVPDPDNLTSPNIYLPSVFRNLRNIYTSLQVLGEKPFYISGFGCKTNAMANPAPVPEYSIDSQAVYYTDFLNLFAEYEETLRIEMVRNYRWSDDPFSDDYFGIIFTGDPTTYDYYSENPVPKPAYYVYKDFIEVYHTPYLWANDSMATAYTNGRKIAIVGDGIGIVYQTNGSIVFVKLSSEGELLECDTISNFTNEPYYFAQPAMAVDNNGNIYVVFVNTEVVTPFGKEKGIPTLFITVKPPHGQWSRPMPIFVSNPSIMERTMYPSVEVDAEGRLHIAALRKNAFYRSIIYGVYRGFSEIRWENVCEVQNIEESCPVLKMLTYQFPNRPSDQVPIIVWRDGNYVKLSARVNGDWIPPFTITDDITAGSPTAVTLTNEIDVAWQSGSTIWFTRLRMPFVPGLRPEKVVDVGNSCAHPFLFRSSKDWHIIYAVLEKSPNPFIGRAYNLFVITRSKTRSGWWDDVRRITNTPLHSEFAQAIPAVRSNFVAIWTEGRYRNYHVGINRSESSFGPVVEVENPEDGFLAGIDDTLTITWTVSPVSSNEPVCRHYIYYSLDGGLTYEFLDSVYKCVSMPAALHYKVPATSLGVTDSLKIKVVCVDIVGRRGTGYSEGLAQIWWLTTFYRGATEYCGENIGIGADGKLHVAYLEAPFVYTEAEQREDGCWRKVIEAETLNCNLLVPSYMPSLMTDMEFESENNIIFFTRTCLTGERRLELVWVERENPTVHTIKLMLDSPVANPIGCGFDAEMVSDTVYLVYAVKSGGGDHSCLYWWKGELGQNTAVMNCLDHNLLVEKNISFVTLCVDSFRNMHIFYVTDDGLEYALVTSEGQVVNGITVDEGERISYLTSCAHQETLRVVYRKVKRGEDGIWCAKKAIGDSRFECEPISGFDHMYVKEFPTLVDYDVVMWVETKRTISFGNCESNILVSRYVNGRWTIPETLYTSKKFIYYPSGLLERGNGEASLHAVWTEGCGKYAVKYRCFRMLTPDITSTMAGELKKTYPLMLATPIPNPARNTVVIKFSVPVRENVRLAIYDAAGRCVRELLNSEVEAGEHVVSWDGRGDCGRIASSGVYFVRLKAESGERLQKLIILR